LSYIFNIVGQARGDPDDARQSRIESNGIQQAKTAMKAAAVSWNDIPSLDNLEVDWDYEPENPLGKRLWSRFGTADLQALLDTGTIPVKVAGRHLSTRGSLLDVSRGGLAMLLDMPMATGQLIRVSLLLGHRKIVSSAIVRNCIPMAGRHRTGVEFVDLDEECATYIAGLISSKIYTI
jgi:hypothetical protein